MQVSGKYFQKQQVLNELLPAAIIAAVKPLTFLENHTDHKRTDHCSENKFVIVLIRQIQLLKIKRE